MDYLGDSVNSVFICEEYNSCSMVAMVTLTTTVVLGCVFGVLTATVNIHCSVKLFSIKFHVYIYTCSSYIM